MFTRYGLSLIAIGTLLLVLAAAGCTAGAIGTAASAPQAEIRSATALQTGQESMPRTVTVSGSGAASAAPDVARVQLGVEVIDSNADNAIEQSTTQMTAVIDTLKALGIAEKDIQTVQYNISLEEQRDTEGQLTGETRYRVNNRIRVTVRDISKTGEALQEALAAGANSVDSVSFDIDDPTALQQQARDAAIADARAKAEQLATGLGAQLGKVRQISEGGGGIPRPEAAPMMARAAEAAVPISGGQLSVSVGIQVTFDLTD